MSAGILSRVAPARENTLRGLAGLGPSHGRSAVGDATWLLTSRGDSLPGFESLAFLFATEAHTDVAPVL